MKVYVYVVEVYGDPRFVCTSIEAARKVLLDKAYSGEEFLQSVAEMQSDIQRHPDMVVFMEKTSSDFLMYRMPLIGELPKPKRKVNIDITPKQLKQEQDEAKSFNIPSQWKDVEENEVEINHRIDQAKEDEQLPW